mgnify:CR=1 FL=1
MRLKFVVIGLAAALLLAACGTRPAESDQAGEGTPTREPSGFVGYVVKKNGDGLLVVGSKEKHFGAGGASHFYDAVWFSHAGSSAEVGQEVEVFSNGEFAESYPAQGKADRVVVLEKDKPAGAALTEAEAVRRALESPELAEGFATAVRSVAYEADRSEWVVELGENGEEKTTTVRVSDRAENGGAEPAAARIPEGGEKPFGNMPPIPAITADGMALQVEQSSYCWSYEGGGRCADYAGPDVMLKDKPKARVKPEAKIEIAFDTKPPTEIYVTSFRDGTADDVKPDGDTPTESAEGSVSRERPAAGTSFVAPAEPGVYYYGVGVWWLKDKETRVSEGSSSYAFAIEVQEASE